MKKFTRKHYNKKLVALGLSAFMGIGLVSTGFAAWVMSKGASETPEGNVNVAIITDASAKIELDQDYATKDGNVYKLTQNFSFNADKEDFEGRLRYDGNDPAECLTITMKGTLTADVPYVLSAVITELPAGIKAAIEKEYIVWDTTYENYTTSKDVDLVSTSDDNVKEFTITLGFKWGTKFGGVNPSLYYDTVDEGIAKNDATMQDELLTFFQVICGLPEKPTSFDELNNYTGTFKIQLSATAPASTPEATE